VNTTLVVMLLVGRMWEPTFVVVYPTEAACQAAAKARTEFTNFGTRKAVCVPSLPPTKEPQP
jgi:hypothetical protein